MEANIPTQFPHVIERRNGRATIYRVSRTKNGREYVEFRSTYFDTDGKTRAKSFNTFDAARRDALARLDALARGIVEVTTLTGPDRLDYLEARRLLPATVTLTDAAKVWLRANDAHRVVPMPVKDLVESFIATKATASRKGRPASPDYLADLRNRLGRFAIGFPCDIADLTGRAIEDWATAEKITGRNRVNTLRLVRTLLRWAQKRGLLPPGAVATDGIDMPVPEGGEIQIFTPGELRSLLETAKPEMVPFLALGAFAGMRSAEIARIGWEDIKVDRGFVEVGRDKAKTRSRRLVPILPALSAWIEPLRAPSGPVVPFANIPKQIGWVARDAGVEWRHNGLRHSFISYRLAEVGNESQVALEAGNSPAMIFAHYRQLVTPTDAREWFGTLPHQPSSIIPMPREVAA